MPLGSTVAPASGNSRSYPKRGFSVHWRLLLPRGPGEEVGMRPILRNGPKNVRPAAGVDRRESQAGKRVETPPLVEGPADDGPS